MRIAAGLASLIVALGFTTGIRTGPSFLVRSDVRIGSFAVKQDGTLGGLERAFGPPRATHRTQTGCRAAWTNYGLTVDVYNLGAQDPCNPKYGYFFRAIMRGPRWHTPRDLHVGDSVRSLQRQYPRARFHSGRRDAWPPGWWLVTRYSPVGTGGFYPGLMATTRDGAVNALYVRFAAGGE